MHTRRDSDSILAAMLMLVAFVVVALVIAYVLTYRPTIAPVGEALSSPDLSVTEMYQLETGKTVTLVTTHGEQYRIEISQDADGYHIYIKHPAHDAPLQFADSNTFEVSWTAHVGEIYLQRNQNSWRLWYPNGWSLSAQTE